MLTTGVVDHDVVAKYLEIDECTFPVQLQMFNCTLQSRGYQMTSSWDCAYEGTSFKNHNFPLFQPIHDGFFRLTVVFRAYFNLQYCTLCVTVIEKCAVLSVKVCSIECEIENIRCQLSIEIIDIECVLLSFLSKNFVATKWPIYKGILARARLLW